MIMFVLSPRLLALLLFVTLLGLSVDPACAGDDAVTGRLIELLVKKGVLPADEAAALLTEAKAGKPKSGKVKAAKNTPAPVPDEEPTVPGEVRVTYVPQIIRDQIAQQVRTDMLRAEVSGESPKPVAVPDRFHFFGDLRLRGEMDRLPGSNAPQFLDFASINGGSPFDANGLSSSPPLLNTTENRSRYRLRARAGVDVDIDDGITAELRLATGNDASPVSANQTLGQNGPFTKYAAWIDRAFVKAEPYDWFTAFAGRMSNPFWTTDLVYYDDLGFDGFAATLSPRFSKNFKGFLSIGAFPVFNTAFNFGTTSPNSGYASRDAWLGGVQAGGEWRASDRIVTKFAAGYFSYSGISGKTSSPCTLVFPSDTCDTDNTRALFPGTGNTMLAVRNILSAPNNTQPQYFGLASPFHILDLHGRVNLEYFNPVVISLESEFAVNLAFNHTRAVAVGVNNFGSAGLPDPGNKAAMIKVSVGTPELAARWDWNVSLTYKYIESDSVLASLNDPDFHLGGTNAKGYILAGNLAIARNTWITARWLSTTQVSGAPYAVDVLQADLNVKF